MKKIISLSILVIMTTVFFTSLIVSDQFTLPYKLPKYYYFWFVFTFLLGLHVVNRIFLKEIKFNVNFNLTDVGVLLFSVYSFIHVLVKEGSLINNTHFIIQMGMVFLYFFTKIYILIYNVNSHNFIIAGIQISTIIQIIKGLSQLFGGQINRITITGFFDNVGPYTNYLSIVGIFLLGYFLFAPKQNYISRLALIIGLAAISITLFLASRAASIALLIGLAYLLQKKYKLWEKVKTIILDSTLKKMIASILFLGLLILISVYTFRVRIDSAKGRLFIWENSIELIKSKPLFGYGIGSFVVEYNDQQAKYFYNNPSNNANAIIADNINFAFNDFIQIAIELGLFGLFIHLFVIYLIFFTKVLTDNNSAVYYFPFKAGILVLLICALFSYPFQGISTQIIFYVFLANVSVHHKKYIFELKLTSWQWRGLSIFMIILIISNFVMQLKRFRASKEWKHASELSQKGQFDKAYPIYKEIYPFLHYDGFYLFNFGSELSINNKPKESITLLLKANTKINASDLYIYLGNSYEQMNDFESAEQQYLKASFMVPNRFFPKYRLVKLYERTDDTTKVLIMAKKVLDQDIKIKSDIVDEIRAEMILTLKKYGKKD